MAVTTEGKEKGRLSAHIGLFRLAQAIRAVTGCVVDEAVVLRSLLEGG